MGKLSFTIPHSLVASIKNGLKLDNFIETCGDYDGETATWASSLFDKVYIVGVNKGRKEKNITAVEGQSDTSLAQLLKEVKGDSIFFLNSHTEKYSALESELKMLTTVSSPIFL